MKLSNIIKTCFAICLTGMAVSCNDGWLDVYSPSLKTPDNTYVSYSGVAQGLAGCEKILNLEATGQMCSLYAQSDICFSGAINYDKSWSPENFNGHFYWYASTESGAYSAIKMANSVIGRIDDFEWPSEAERNKALGQAYFHRAYWYYALTHVFGDVPFVSKETKEPKWDFYTNDRWSILAQLEKDLEYAWENVPDGLDRGRVGKGAVGILYQKILIENGNFDKAIEVGNAIVAAHPLVKSRMVTERFNQKTFYPASMSMAETNLMHDLHSKEGKICSANTEVLLCCVNGTNYDNGGNRGSVKWSVMSQAVPNFEDIKTPDGKTGVTYDSNVVEDIYDINHNYGHGGGSIRPTNYYQYEIWTANEANDMRGRFNKQSWKSPEDMCYNHPELKKNNSEWYGKPLVREENMNPEDSLNRWYSWPFYKLFAPDPESSTDWYGGQCTVYIYRSAEAYLLNAEAYYWKGELAKAAQALNPVRERAGAAPLNTINGIEDILAERARELYFEEPRKIELNRIAYTYAKTGKVCEWNGKKYSLNNITGPVAENSNCKDAGVNFWYDWVMEKNNFFKCHWKYQSTSTTVSVNHMLLPIPKSAIEGNFNGIINQNAGYRQTPYQAPKPVNMDEQ